MTLGDAAHPLDDALCNGVLLGRVAAALALRAGVPSSPPPHARPRLPSHARANLTAALRLLRRAGVGAAPLNAAERALHSIILGERRPLWALLDALRCHGPPPPPTAAASAAAEAEAEVLRWLLGAGLLRHEIAHEIAGSLGTDLPALALPTLVRVMPFVCTGELLCDVAAHVSQQRVCGVFRPPRTRATALANVRKATARLQPLLAAARLLRSTSEWSDERLLRGDRHAALAWLCAARSCVARSCAAEPPPDALDVDVLPPHGHLAAAAAAAAYEDYEVRKSPRCRRRRRCRHRRRTRRRRRNRLRRHTPPPRSSHRSIRRIWRVSRSGCGRLGCRRRRRSSTVQPWASGATGFGCASWWRRSSDANCRE